MNLQQSNKFAFLKKLIKLNLAQLNFIKVFNHCLKIHQGVDVNGGSVTIDVGGEHGTIIDPAALGFATSPPQQTSSVLQS